MVDNQIAQRIAVALERIATALESSQVKPSTAFPWHNISDGTRKRIMTGLDDEKTKWGRMTQYSWPLTCEDIVAIGPPGLREFRYVGDKAIDEIQAELVSMGFTMMK